MSQDIHSDASHIGRGRVHLLHDAVYASCLVKNHQAIESVCVGENGVRSDGAFKKCPGANPLLSPRPAPAPWFRHSL